MAHKKGLGSSKNGRDSNAQRLGVKIIRRTGGHRRVDHRAAARHQAEARPERRARQRRYAVRQDRRPREVHRSWTHRTLCRRGGDRSGIAPRRFENQGRTPSSPAFSIPYQAALRPPRPQKQKPRGTRGLCAGGRREQLIEEQPPDSWPEPDRPRPRCLAGKTPSAHQP